MKTTHTFERFYCDTVRDLWVLYECLKTAALKESQWGALHDVEGARREVLDRLAQSIADLNALSYNLDISEEDNRQEIIKALQLRRTQFSTEKSDMEKEHITDLLRSADEDGIISIGDISAHEQEMQDMEMQDPNTNDQQ